MSTKAGWTTVYLRMQGKPLADFEAFCHKYALSLNSGALFLMARGLDVEKAIDGRVAQLVDAPKRRQRPSKGRADG